jgi:hypothetical protein
MKFPYENLVQCSMSESLKTRRDAPCGLIILLSSTNLCKSCLLN